jgi:hypothetical protein
MSVVTKAELSYGVEVSPRRAQDAVALSTVLPYVDAVAFNDGNDPMTTPRWIMRDPS